MMEEKKGLVFDVQPYSVHDGPGCRTLVFLSGCPLSCNWCANPEGVKSRKRIMFRAGKCVHQSKGCVRCIEACPYNAITLSGDEENPLIFDRSLCDKCETFECEKACLHEAINLSGEWMSSDELMKVFNRDRHYWAGKGGVTFSGGEALMQNDFLKTTLKKCKDTHIHTAIETTAFASTDNFLDTFKYIDFAFIDVKNMDADRHKERTGVSNELILKNIEALAKSDWKGRVVLRMPVIREYNDSDKNVNAVADYMNRIGLYEINILPFHRLGDSKYAQLGMKYKYSQEEPTPPEKLDYIQDIFLDKGIACYIGSDTPF